MKSVEQVKKHFYETLAKYEDIYDLANHLPEVEKWAHKLLEFHPEADREVLLLSIWLHDIGHYHGEEDHAIASERIAKEFLQQIDIDKEKVDKILHCVRAHRNKDVKPATLEAKMMACVDSASHMTDTSYISIAMSGRFDYAKGKMERDYRDFSVFPEIEKLLKPLYDDWKKLLEDYEKIDLK